MATVADGAGGQLVGSRCTGALWQHMNSEMNGIGGGLRRRMMDGEMVGTFAVISLKDIKKSYFIG